ncbi:hypothetical protein [Bordetella genomosp. 5]|uniref:hypothetical protein n=1 Tax=Bordetella genomosp. 5 TaxID=1395608 RepID=UPI00159561D3|nr:hypothetical protein [Bordetella genomosp. 5]
MSKWNSAVREGLRSGTAASLLSTAVLMAAGRRYSDSAYAPTNATSQWLWGRPALRADGPSVRHTVTGYVVHHGASLFWAALHARATQDLPRADTPGGAMVGGMAAAAVACFADYVLTPKRFTPGFEHRLPRTALFCAYLAFGAGIGLASLLWRRRQARTKESSMTEKFPDRISGQPDTNAGALRPSGRADTPATPDLDHPPRVQDPDGTGFDRAEAVEEREARDGTLPGAPETNNAAVRRPNGTPVRDN